MWTAAAGAGEAEAVSAGNRQEGSNSLVEMVTRVMSRRIRELDAERRSVQAELAALPKPPNAQNGGTLGFHSRIVSHPSVTKWVQVDLGETVDIDAIALIPAHVVFEDHPGPGYGFPWRFRVDLSNDGEFNEFQTVADHTRSDFPNPGDSPVVIPTPGERTRFIRVTATRLWERNKYGIFALGELMVLRGNRNIAARRPVTASDSIDSPFTWSLAYLVDNQSVLGNPVAREQMSRSNGYHSAFEQSASHVKWVEVDLGRTVPVDEIRLIPARPVDYADIPGFGFPRRFQILLSTEPAGGDAFVIFDHQRADFPNPGDNPVVIPAGGKEARYIRVAATELWERASDFALAFAELQAYSGNTNAALGVRVNALDSIEANHWSTNFLVDGFSSQYRLMEYPDWLRGLARRHQLLGRLAEVENERTLAVAAVVNRSIRWSVSGGLLTAVVLGLGFYWSRLVRLRELEALRNRIASDLHDELGASLTQIGLLGELAQRDRENPARVQQHAGKISHRAREAVEALDQVIWTVNPKNDRLDRLTAYFGQYAEQFFEPTPVRCRVEVPPRLPPQVVSTEVRHNLFLAFKEALNNLVKHAEASEVWIRFTVEGKSVRLTIEDNGQGFDSADEKPERLGLSNLRTRLVKVGGSFRIEPRQPRGTRLEFVVPV